MCLRGKNKLADKWDKDPYVVIDIPDKNVPVYKVQRESGNPTVKALHRNMLLPFSVFYSILISSLVSAAGENATYKPQSSHFCVCSPCFEIYIYIQIKMLSLRFEVAIS